MGNFAFIGTAWSIDTPDINEGDTRYKELYEIVQPDLHKDSWPFKYKLIYKPTGDIVGEYKDEVYAIKQARFKYKKHIKKVEKILLSDG